VPLEVSSVLDLISELHDKPGAAILLVVSAKSMESAYEDPVEVASRSDGEACETWKKSSNGEGSAKKGSTTVRILHVVDESDTKEVVERALRLDSEFATRSVGAGKGAVVVAAEWQPDIILFDVMMRAMDGPATLAHLRADKQTSDIPVIFMTARAQVREIEMLNAPDATGVIVKPFDPMTLAAVVRTYLPKPVIDLRSLRDNFRKRVKLEAIVLSKYRLSIQDGSASTALLAGIRTIAHGLAGAGGMFGFDRISAAASSLETAVIMELDGSGVGGIVPALEGLLGSATALSDEQ
jgi:CheY-like chemotaxis protein